MVDFLQCFSFEFFVFRNHNLLKWEKIIAEEYLLEDFSVFLSFHALYYAFLECFFGYSNLFNHGLEKQCCKPCEFLEDFSVLKLVFFCIVKYDAIFFDEVKKRITPNRRCQVLATVIVDPFLILSKFVGFLWFFLYLWSKEPLEH